MLVLLGYSLATAKVEEAVQTPVDLTYELDWDQIGDAGLEDPATQSAFLQPSFQNPIVHWIIHGGPVSVWGSPPLSTDVVDIDLMSVIQTSYLAQHYFRQTPNDGLGPRCLIVTPSSSSFYRASMSPVYCSAKFGTVGWTRSIAAKLWKEQSVRVNVSIRSAARLASQHH